MIASLDTSPHSPLAQRNRHVSRRSVERGIFITCGHSYIFHLHHYHTYTSSIQRPKYAFFDEGGGSKWLWYTRSRGINLHTSRQVSPSPLTWRLAIFLKEAPHSTRKKSW